jgi:NADH:ubiquinone oxidoreductase subunit F (NADH-binding)
LATDHHQHVETLANIPQIIVKGGIGSPRWTIAARHESIALGGKINNTGLDEIRCTTLRQILFEIGAVSLRQEV